MKRESAKSFKDLIVWQKAHHFVLEVYKISRSFPKEERYGLVSQFRRAAVSIPANIAEGFKRRGKADKARFFNIAQGSLEECQYFLVLTQDLKYAEVNTLKALLDEVSKLLESYTSAIISSKS